MFPLETHDTLEAYQLIFLTMAVTKVTITNDDGSTQDFFPQTTPTEFRKIPVPLATPIEIIAE